MANKISVIIDVATSGANAALGNFRKSIADADGASNKLKAGAAGAFDSIKQNAGNMALAAGTALVAFGAKSVAAFNDLAIESGRMAEALGVPVEEMSKLIEVAGDLGIESDTLEKVLGKMNQTAGKSPAAFESIGAEIVKTQSGATDVNATFLATVDALNRIQDPARRAAAAQEIFGRSWRDSAELIGLGSKKIVDAMGDVSDAKIINDDEVKKARDYRAAMDALSDSIEDLMLNVGSALVPVITQAAETTDDARNAFSDLDDALGPVDESLIKVAKSNWEYLNPVGQGIKLLGLFSDSNDDATESLTGQSQALVQASVDAALAEQATKNLAAAQEDAKDAYVEHAEGMQRESRKTTEALIADMRRLRGEMSDRSAYLDVEEAFAAMQAAGVQAFDGTEESARDFERAQIDATQATLDYVEGLKGVPPEVKSEIAALIDEGAFTEVERRLATLEKIRIARITPETYMPGGGVSVKSGTKLHSGGVAGVGKFASDEVPAVLRKGEMVLTEGQQASVANALGGGGGGGNINITVTGLTGPQVADDLVNKIMEYKRRNGGLPWQ